MLFEVKISFNCHLNNRRCCFNKYFRLFLNNGKFNKKVTFFLSIDNNCFQMKSLNGSAPSENKFWLHPAGRNPVFYSK